MLESDFDKAVKRIKNKEDNPMKTVSQKRIQYIDLAKGFGICIVVFFHVRGLFQLQYHPIIANLLFSCCMLPPFFLISGLFFKEEPFDIFLKKKVKSLLIPFLFFYILSAVLIPNIAHYFFGMHFNTVTGWASLWAFIWPCEYPNIPLWFLWCLFLMCILFWGIVKFCRQYFPNHFQKAVITIVVILALVGFLISDYTSHDIANICDAFQNIPFMCIGYFLMRSAFVEKTAGLKRNKKFYLILSSLVLSLIFSALYDQETLGNHILCFYLCGIAGSLLILSLSSLINKLPIVSYFGRYSIIILATHGILIRVCTPLAVYLSPYLNDVAASLLVWVFILLSYLIWIPLLKTLLPHILVK